MTSNVSITEKKENQYVCQIIYIDKGRGHLPTKVIPDIDFTDKPVVQCDVSVGKIQKKYLHMIANK